MTLDQIYQRVRMGLLEEPAVFDGLLFRMDERSPEMVTVRAADPRLGGPTLRIPIEQLNGPESLERAIRHLRFYANTRITTLDELLPYVVERREYLAYIGGMVFYDATHQDPNDTTHNGDPLLVLYLPEFEATYPVLAASIARVGDITQAIDRFMLALMVHDVFDEDDEDDEAFLDQDSDEFDDDGDPFDDDEGHRTEKPPEDIDDGELT